MVAASGVDRRVFFRRSPSGIPDLRIIFEGSEVGKGKLNSGRF